MAFCRYSNMVGLLIRELGKSHIQHVQERTVHIRFDIKAHNAANLHTNKLFTSAQRFSGDVGHMVLTKWIWHWMSISVSWSNEANTIFQLTFCQWRSLIPGLQMVLRMGRCCLNWSILLLKLLATRTGPGRSDKDLVSLCMVLHMTSSSSEIFSASSCRKGPWGQTIEGILQCEKGLSVYHWSIFVPFRAFLPFK